MESQPLSMGIAVYQAKVKPVASNKVSLIWGRNLSTGHFERQSNPLMVIKAREKNNIRLRLTKVRWINFSQ